MSSFVPLPLGQRIPASVHGVSCSLPTMRAVIGYEEKDPEIVRHLSSGYPRFVLHPYVRQLSEIFRQELQLDGQTVWLASSARTAEELAHELGAPHVTRFVHDGLPGVAHPENPELFARAKVFLQNTGGFLSSREAEDHLVQRGQIAAREHELGVKADALNRVVRVLQRAFPGTSARDIVLAPSGMAAFHSAWRTMAELQASRGRTVWIQLGWLYLDTIALLKRFAARPEDYVYLQDVGDLAAVAAACEAAGTRLAGVVTEAPTNPLVQTADLAALSKIAREHGGRTLVDPTLVSAFNLQVLPHADVVVNSLTKYAANEGDVLAGAIVINPEGPDADLLRATIARRTDSIYRRDLERLAAEIESFEQVVDQINTSAPAVVEFLRAHPQVDEVFWSLQSPTRDNYLKYARSPKHVGGLISFTIRKPLAEFYDRLRLAKGPSFGMRQTLICPYIYLAHYDLVTSAEGRRELAASGVSPGLFRLSVGCEPAEQIIAALKEALDE